MTLSPYFSAAKIKWIIDNVSGAREKAERGDLLAGTIDSWLVWKLTNGAVHATDLTNASRMSLLNLKTLKWDEAVCKLFTVPVSMLADIKRSDTIWAETDLGGNSDKMLPISVFLETHTQHYSLNSAINLVWQRQHMAQALQ